MKHLQSQAGETVIDFLMSHVVPVVGTAIAIGVLSEATSLPFWACVIVGLVGGTIGAWAVAFAILAGLGFIVELLSKLFATRR